MCRGAALTVVLCLGLLAGREALAADPAPATKTKFVVINNAYWSSTLIAVNTSATESAILTPPACSQLGVPGIEIKPGGAFKLEHFGDCFGAAPVRVVEVTTTGALELKNDGVYRDPAGKFNFVSLPPITTWAETSSYDTLVFNAVERTRDEQLFAQTGQTKIVLSTFLALFSEGGGLTAAVNIFGADGLQVGTTQSVPVSGFNFYELPELVPIGRAQVQAFPTAGCAGCTAPRLYAIAFTGYHDAGGPRVIRPSLLATSTN